MFQWGGHVFHFNGMNANLIPAGWQGNLGKSGLLSGEADQMDVRQEASLVHYFDWGRLSRELDRKQVDKE